MLLSTSELQQMVRQGLLTELTEDAIKGTSIDVRLGSGLLVETKTTAGRQILVAGRDKLHCKLVTLSDTVKFYMEPGCFLLAALVERITLPSTVTAKFYLSSTLARLGLEHSAAISIKPGWEGILTLELKNVSQYHTVVLTKDMAIGCLEFTQHNPGDVYAGKYTQQEEVSG